MELKEMASSGAQVPKAAIVSAIRVLGARMLVAKDEAESTKTSDALTNAKRPMARRMMLISISIILIYFRGFDQMGLCLV
jgi:hypothetical protein